MFMPFLDSVEKLQRANVLTGHFDNARFQLCKKEFKDFTDEDKEYLYFTEKNSRKNVEDRGVARTEIDTFFENLFEGNL